MAQALDVAKFFLAVNPPNTISNYKLQKLCAYAQAIHIAYLDKELFPGTVEIWNLELVVPEVYNAYKDNENRKLDQAEIDFNVFTPKEKEFLTIINDEYKDQENAWNLCLLYHGHYTKIRGVEIITFKDMKQAFGWNDVAQNLINADKRGISYEEMKKFKIYADFLKYAL